MHTRFLFILLREAQYQAYTTPRRPTGACFPVVWAIIFVLPYCVRLMTTSITELGRRLPAAVPPGEDGKVRLRPHSTLTQRVASIKYAPV